VSKDPAQNPYLASPGSAAVFQSGKSAATIRSAATTGMIITFALAQGVIVIGAVALWMALGDRGEDQPLYEIGGESLIFQIVGAVAILGGVGGAAVLRMLMRHAAVQNYLSAEEPLPQPLDEHTPLPPAAGQLIGGESAATIVGQALCEGAVVINLIFLLLSENLIFLLPSLIGLVGIVIQIPTSGRLQSVLTTAAGR